MQLIRNSLKHFSYKDHKVIVKDLRLLYQAATEDDTRCARRVRRRVQISVWLERWYVAHPLLAARG